MDEPTSSDVTHTLFFAPVDPASQAPNAHVQRRVDMLATLVMDLLMEVEALRTVAAGERDYRSAYLKTGLLSHDSTGPSMGWDKLLQLYYPFDRESTGRAWRESLMLDRLGLTADEIQAYRKEALGMEVTT